MKSTFILGALAMLMLSLTIALDTMVWFMPIIWDTDKVILTVMISLMGYTSTWLYFIAFRANLKAFREAHYNNPLERLKRARKRMESARKVLIVIVIMLMSAGAVNAQRKKLVPDASGNYTAIEHIKGDSTQPGGTPTGHTYTNKGVSYPIFKTSRGAYYVNRVSKKTGNSYKQYLPL